MDIEDISTNAQEQQEEAEENVLAYKQKVNEIPKKLLRKSAQSQKTHTISFESEKRAAKNLRAEAKKFAATNGYTAPPAVQTVYMETFGCSHNTSDSEYMAGILKEFGYEVTDSPARFYDVDGYVFNTCTVKNPTQDSILGLIEKAIIGDPDNKKPVVVSGCLTQSDKPITQMLLTKYSPRVSVLGVQQIHRIAEVMQQAFEGNSVCILGRDTKFGKPEMDLPKIRKNKWIEIISISVGCLNFCSYCKTKYSRGNLGSFPMEAILSRVRTVLSEGVKEIRITSEDVGAWGIDLGTHIGVLVKEIVKVVKEYNKQHEVFLEEEILGTKSLEALKGKKYPYADSLGKVMVRLGMTNPPYMLKHIQDICEVLNEDCVFEFLHIPVQSGADPVLFEMNRQYTRKEFELMCDTLIDNVYVDMPQDPKLLGIEEIVKETKKQDKEPEIIHQKVHLMTDIIAGFPTEKEEDWEQTMEMCRKYKFQGLNISKFYARQGTPAAAMPLLNTKEVKKRSSEVSALWKSYQSFSHYVGKYVYVYGIGIELAKDDENLIGHTKDYAQVLIDSKEMIDFDENGKEIKVENGLEKADYQELIVGACSLVKIVKSGKFFLIGQIVRSAAWKKAIKQLIAKKQVKKEEQKEKNSYNLVGKRIDVPATPFSKGAPTDGVHHPSNPKKIGNQNTVEIDDDGEVHEEADRSFAKAEEKPEKKEAPKKKEPKKSEVKKGKPNSIGMFNNLWVQLSLFGLVGIILSVLFGIIRFE